MGNIIAIANQKGGVGKSTTALALSEVLGSRNYRILLVDMDAQMNTTFASGVKPGRKTITDIFDGDPVNQAIIQTKYYNIIPADKYLTNIERAEDIKPTLLNDVLTPIKNKFNYIIIDCPPALGNSVFNVMRAADYVLIPLEARPFALQGLTALYDTITAVRERGNKMLQILGILLVKYHTRSILNRDLRDTIADYAKKKMQTTVLQSFIRESIVVPESQTMQQPLIDYAPKSNPVKDYNDVVDEILNKIGE